MGTCQDASMCPPCDALEELLSNRRASASGKGGVFDKFQLKKIMNQFCRPRLQSLSRLEVNCALSPELNQLFT